MMHTRVVTRRERREDSSIIADIVKRAYADVVYSDHREHVMIDCLRRTDAFLPELSLLAEVDHAPAGHVLSTKATIWNRHTSVETQTLAPLSVVPEHQRRGVGRKLMEAAHAQAAALGFESIVSVSIPNYYQRCGYEPLSRYPITLPFSAPPDNCMIFSLRPAALAGVAGVIEYAPGWLEH